MQTYYDTTKGGTVVTIYSGEGYTQDNKKLLRVKNNGNGFTVKYYSWLPSSPDLYWSIPYDVAADLVDALEQFDYRDEQDYE